MNRRYRSAISAIAILVYAVVGVTAMHAETLCLGPGGHIALEGPAASDKCHGPNGSIDSPFPSGQTIGIKATDCVDFALPGRTSLKAQESQDAKVSLHNIDWAVFNNEPRDSEPPARVLPTDSRAMSARTLTSHRSVLLLI